MKRLRHGTYGAAQQHRLRGETPCEPCREADNAYHREYRAEHPAYAKRNRARNRASARAKSRLARQYPDIFQRLYDDELAREGVTP